MKYRVTLTAAERSRLQSMVSKGKASAREIMHAQVLLRVDRAGPCLTDLKTAASLGISARTVQRIRERCSRQTLDSALSRKSQPARPKKRKVHDELEVRTIALACSDPPEGRKRWTLRLLSEKLVALELSQDPVSYETVRQILKKTSFDLTASKGG
jgi:Homeodomain-like domain